MVGTGFKLLLAVSADGFLAKGPDDDMKWTGSVDKAVFRLLTLSTSGPILAGRCTAEMMPMLKGRRLMAVSRGPMGISLQAAAWAHRDAWLVGGPEIARAALEANLVESAFICRVLPVNLGSGIPFEPIAKLLERAYERQSIAFGGDYHVDVLKGLQHGA